MAKSVVISSKVSTRHCFVICRVPIEIATHSTYRSMVTLAESDNQGAMTIEMDKGIIECIQHHKTLLLIYPHMIIKLNSWCANINPVNLKGN